MDNEKYDQVEEFLKRNNKAKTLHLIDDLYKEIWSLTRNLDQNMVGYITVLISITAVTMYSLHKGQYLFLATIVSQLALLWILVIIIESGYTYRYLQAISINIEKKFGGKAKNCNWHGILPSSYQVRKYGLREIHKIHFALFGTYFSFLPWIYLVYGRPSATRWPIIYFVVIIIHSIVALVALLLCHFWKKEGCRKTKEKNENENFLFFCTIFLPFIIIIGALIVYCIPEIFKCLTQKNVEIIDVFLTWILGVVLLFFYDCYRKTNFYKNFPHKNSNCANLKNTSNSQIYDCTVND